MKLKLCRNYFENGTNGLLYNEEGDLLSFTIELPWKDNERRISCIPEGTYRMVKRYSQKFKHHILLEGTSPRELILIHPANNAKKELAGCIAPVSKLTGEGTGDSSRVKFDMIKDLVYKTIDSGEDCFIEIAENK